MSGLGCRNGTCVVVMAVLPLVLAGPALGQAEFRAFWADVWTSSFMTSAQVNEMVSRAVAGRYNAIVSEVLAYQDYGSGSHGAFWRSNIVPRSTVVTTNYDPLAYLCQQAHAQGIEVHAWIVPFRVGASWPPSGNATLSAHPEWVMVPEGNMGTTVPIGTDYTLDPGSPDVQEYLMSIVRELVTNYPIDGINWDYIRYTQTDAGYPASTSYTKSTLARFQTITGYVGTPPPTGENSWNNFRRRTIDEIIRRARAEIPSIRTNPRQPLRNTADVFAVGDAPFNFESTSAYVYHQNWRYWMEMGWLDAAVPMNYKREHRSDQAQWYRNWVDAAIGWRYNRHVFCGQGNYLNGFENSLAQLQYAYSAGANGTANYDYQGTRATEILCDSYDTEFPDWTWYSYIAANLFTSPAPTPTMPWRNSATATEGTLWGRVTDFFTGLPVDDATVLVSGVGTVQTDGNGYYVVTLIPAGAGGTLYNVTASKGGYPNRKDTAAVVAGDVARLDLDLGNMPGDFDGDGDIDLSDYRLLALCMSYSGPAKPLASTHLCMQGSTGNGYQTDLDGDMNVDMADAAKFQNLYPAP
jgi:uncharacterized lipoprotein YddW (UPF0748 family)